MIFYGIYNEIIIIRMPFTGAQIAGVQNLSNHKNMKLYYWNGNTFTHEDKDVLSSINSIRTLLDLINAWLTIESEEEQQLTKKVALQSVMIDATGHEAFISFDRTPFIKRNQPNKN